MKNIQGKHILFIVENLPVPFDRRVWQEATTLKENGMEVSIICPQMKGYSNSYEVLEGIEIYRHPLPFEARGAIGYLFEYGAAIFWEMKLAKQIYKKKPFHVIHGCNPPDLIYLTAKLFKNKGVKYVFDHHDINPELYIAKYDKKDFFYNLMKYFEKQTFKHAVASIATNESYKKIAIERGGMKPENVQVVRSGPKLDRLQLQAPKEEFKKGRTYLLGYLGVIGEQEGIDLLLDSMKHIVTKRQDVQLAIVGGGSDLELLKKMSDEKGLAEYVDFYGRVSDQVLLDVLNTADVCVNPDKPTEMNNLSTMNKIMEYMALKKPIVQYDLKEGRFSAQEASFYANNTIDFAEKIMLLLDDANLRLKMGEFGYNRVLKELSWEFESKKLINFYNKVLS
ncbi:glycosyltransferase family 4 protein [Lutibacter sp.]|uniref:glycosyltransferase family 4 protein n=1 Tax=Lutibacter sp. TaxID=1925666 RepID=UPI001A242848|nr:glycosyltransferase family 4 protein [Lutibacter sp.]MBI9041330.1 glycosyltransferase family 4 protein [Lutibacter sp.]